MRRNTFAYLASVRQSGAPVHIDDQQLDASVPRQSRQSPPLRTTWCQPLRNLQKSRIVSSLAARPESATCWLLCVGVLDDAESVLQNCLRVLCIVMCVTVLWCCTTAWAFLTGRLILIWLFLVSLSWALSSKCLCNFLYIFGNAF